MIIKKITAKKYNSCSTDTPNEFLANEREILDVCTYFYDPK